MIENNLFPLLKLTDKTIHVLKRTPSVDPYLLWFNQLRFNKQPAIFLI